MTLDNIIDTYLPVAKPLSMAMERQKNLTSYSSPKRGGKTKAKFAGIHMARANCSFCHTEMDAMLTSKHMILEG